MATLKSDSRASKANLRKFVELVLVLDSDFNALCLDFFPDVWRRFSDGMDRVAKTSLLLELADYSSILEALRWHSPHKYAKYERILGGNEEAPQSIPNLRQPFVFALNTRIILSVTGLLCCLSILFYVFRKKERSYYCGNILQKKQHSPISRAEVILLATNCKQITDQNGYFSFESCQAARTEKTILQKALIKLPSGVFCDNIPLENPPFCTKIDIENNCRAETTPASNPDPTPKPNGEPKDMYDNRALDLDMSMRDSGWDMKQQNYNIDMKKSDINADLRAVNDDDDNYRTTQNGSIGNYQIDLNFRYIVVGDSNIQETYLAGDMVARIKSEAVYCEFHDSVFIRRIKTDFYLLKCNDSSDLATELTDLETINFLKNRNIESGWLRIRRGNKMLRDIVEPDIER